MITIKKYRNRRLYNTASSRYVNLEDVAEMVRNGEEFEVIDVTTNEDLTRVVLTQIIMEGAKDNEQGMPVEFLRQLIASSGRAQHELITRYTSFLTGMYQRAQSEFRDRLRNSESDAQAGVTNPLDSFQRFMQPGAFEAMWNRSNATEDNQTSSADGNGQSDTAAELEILRRKIDDLEESMKRSAATQEIAPDGVDNELES